MRKRTEMIYYIFILLCLLFPATAAETSESAVSPESAEECRKRGFDRLTEGDYDGAIADFTRALTRKSDFAEALHERGIAWFSKGDYDRAIADYTAALEINPLSSEAFHNRGGAWLYKKAYNRAVEDFSKVLDIRPDDFEAYSNRGTARFYNCDYENALADQLKAIEINKNYFEAYLNAAWLLAACPDAGCRNGEKAVELAKKAVEMNPGPDTLDTLAAAYAEAGNFEDAVSAQKSIIASLNAESTEQKTSEYANRLKSYEAGKPWREKCKILPPPDTADKADEKKPAEIESEKEEKPMQQQQKEDSFSDKTAYTVHLFSYLNNREMSERTVSRLRKEGNFVIISVMRSAGAGDWYHIFVGRYKTLEGAQAAVEKWKEKGFKADAVLIRSESVMF